VKELEDAEVYLDASNAKSATSLDLLLGTQGWRRFATADEAKFLAAYGDQARRALANLEPAPPVPQSAVMGGVRGAWAPQGERNRVLLGAAARWNAPQGRI